MRGERAQTNALSRQPIAIALDVIPEALAAATDGSILVASWQGVQWVSHRGEAIPIGDPESIVPLSTAPIVSPKAISVDVEGRLLVAGTSRSSAEAFVLRLGSDGQPDPSFGRQGVVQVGEGTIRKMTIEPQGVNILGSAAGCALVAQLGDSGERVAQSGVRVTRGESSRQYFASLRSSSDHCPVVLASGTIVVPCRYDFEHEHERDAAPYAAELAAVIVDRTSDASSSRVRRVAPNLHITAVTDAAAMDDDSVVVVERTLAGLRVTKLCPPHYAVDRAFGSAGHVHVLRSVDEEPTWGPFVHALRGNRLALAWSFGSVRRRLEWTTVAVYDAQSGRRTLSYTMLGVRGSAFATALEDDVLLIAGATNDLPQPGRIEMVSV